MPKVPVTCQECGKAFEALQSEIKRGGGKYCSVECAVKSRIGEKNHMWKPKIKRLCENCGKEFEVLPNVVNRGGGKFCSKKCKTKPKIKRICEGCGKEFEVYLYKLQSGRGKYCSKTCLYNSRSKIYMGKNNPNWKNAQIKRICKTCGKEFFFYQSELKFRSCEYCSTECSGDAPKKPNRICPICNKEFYANPFRLKDNRGGKFCSKECSGIWQSQNIRGEKSYNWKPKIKKNCPTCGKEFEISPSRERNSFEIYCSRKCRGIALSKTNVGENNPHWKGGSLTKKCEECGKEFTVIRALEKTGRFCSRKCHGQWNSKNIIGVNHPNWTGGRKEYCEKWSPEFRRRIRAFFNHICVECGTPQNDELLHCHHVYYDKKACCSVMEGGKYYSNLGIKGKPFSFEIIGDPNKFVALCHNCHTKTTAKKNRLFWARHFEDIINNYYGGKSYFTQEEYKKIR